MDENSLVDAVITWVDGNDPAHRLKRDLAIQRSSDRAKTAIKAGSEETRFHDNGELDLCIKSIRRFAPWIHRIFVITDNQRPSFLTKERLVQDNIRIVDHSVIFRDYEWALPTFNSISIESVMWRIPDLNERFIYFNDDFFLLAETREQDFFIDEKVILRGEWVKLKKHRQGEYFLNQLINFLAEHVLGIQRTMHLRSQMNGALLVGQQGRYFRFPHTPHPLRVSTFSEIYETSGDQQVLIQNIRFPFRDMSQHLSVAAANHWEIKHDNAALHSAHEAILVGGDRIKKQMFDQLIRDLLNSRYRFLCVNSLEKMPRNMQMRMKETINSIVSDNR